MTDSPSVTWPSAAITTLPLRRTHRTVVERIRGERPCSAWAKMKLPPDSAAEDNPRFDILLTSINPDRVLNDATEVRAAAVRRLEPEARRSCLCPCVQRPYRVLHRSGVPREFL